jgi:hypothetical protein
MTVRAVEWKNPYTGGKAIDINEDKVISLRLRDENNLIIYDEGDDEIYVDLQLDNEIEPTDAFPVWITTWRAIVANWWDVTGTLICAKTTSWDNIKILYSDQWQLFIDNGTGTFKQIYLKPEIDAILQDYVTLDYLQANYPTTEYVDSHDTQVSATEPTTPTEWMLWYNTSNWKLKVYNGSAWQDVGSWGGSYTAWNWIDIDANNEISIDTSVVATQNDISVISGDNGTTYTIKVSNTAPSAGTPDTTLTFVY